MLAVPIGGSSVTVLLVFALVFGCFLSIKTGIQPWTSERWQCFLVICRLFVSNQEYIFASNKRTPGLKGEEFAFLCLLGAHG